MNKQQTLGIIGAGLMGEGIASVSLPKNLVILKDISDKALTRAKERITNQLSKINQTQLLNNFQCTTKMEDLAHCELIIEAVFEDLKLKQQILSEVEAVVSETAVFASNTSGLPITQIAANAKHPERVLGMHYFSPVPKMPLLEIIITPKTTERALATAHSCGTAQGKNVIVVKDGPGFYTTRILVPLLHESILLLEEGASIEEVDKALKDFGFPLGPIALVDEVGIDVAAHVSRDLGLAFGTRWGKISDVLYRIYKAGFLGKKNLKGFYTYFDGKRQNPNPEIYKFFDAKTKQTFDPGEITDRVVLMMVNEAVHCLQEKTISSARDGDMGAVLGLGFPPHRGGPFHYIKSVGASVIVNRMEELVKKCGPRFEPASLLRKL